MSKEILAPPALPALPGEGFVVPEQIASAGPAAAERFVEFFIATIRNVNTRRAYHRAAMRFFDWCDQVGLADLDSIRPIHLAAYVEALTRSHERATVKLHLARHQTPV